jgi:hypothetical protein
MDTYTFAIDSLQLGDEKGDSWMRYGFDLDGKVTDAKSKDGCALIPGAPSSVQVDGTRDGFGGIDNSFGAYIVPMLDYMRSEPLSTSVTRWIRGGLFTLQLAITGLDRTTAQTNIGLRLGSFRSAIFDPDGGAMPAFLPAEDWPARTDGVVDADASALRSKDSFEDSYATNGTFVSGIGDLTFATVLDDAPVDLHIHHAIVVMVVRGDAARGTIAGVLDAEEFVGAARIWRAVAVSRFVALPSTESLSRCASAPTS